MNELLTNPAVLAAGGTLAALALSALIKLVHGAVTKSANKLDDKIYDAVAAAFKDAEK